MTEQTDTHKSRNIITVVVVFLLFMLAGYTYYKEYPTSKYHKDYIAKKNVPDAGISTPDLGSTTITDLVSSDGSASAQ